MPTRKEALHESLKALSPNQIHYVWGLLDGLRHIENVTGKTEQELQEKNAQGRPRNKDEQKKEVRK